MLYNIRIETKEIYTVELREYQLKTLNLVAKIQPLTPFGWHHINQKKEGEVN